MHRTAACPETAPQTMSGNSEGWRFWMILPGTAVLASPLQTSGSVLRWPLATMQAQCPLPHMPPAPDCRCGIYADHTAIQAYTRMEHWRQTFGTWLPMLGPGVVPVCAIGRIALVDAVEYELVLKPGVWPQLLPPGLGEGYRELRARTASLIELYLCGDDWKLAAQLAERYQVPVMCQPQQSFVHQSKGVGVVTPPTPPVAA